MKSALAALFTVACIIAPAAFAQDIKQPSAEECKKDPKMKGCEIKEEKKKVKGGC